MDWGNHLEKNSIQKIEKKTVKNILFLSFVQTPFSRSTLKLERKKNSRRKTTISFAPFPVSWRPKSQIQLDFKNHANFWTDLEKRQRPNTIQILCIVKKTYVISDNQAWIELPEHEFNCSQLFKWIAYHETNKAIRNLPSNIIPSVITSLLQFPSQKSLKFAVQIEKRSNKKSEVCNIAYKTPRGLI